MTGHLPILTFHDIADDGAVVSTCHAVFEQGMERLHAAGFRTLSLAEGASLLHRGEELPDRRVIITFDDGHESVHRLAFPVLQRFGFTATVFITVGEQPPAGADSRLPPLEGRTLLRWREILEMHGAGFEFGAHTLTHPDLTQLTEENLEREILESKRILEDALGAPVPSFAYPFGRYDARSLDVARQHFTCACSDALGFATAASDLHTLERLDTYYLRRPGLYGKLGTAALRWYVRARNVPRRLRRAIGR